jgi:hypothetical protein
VDIVAEIRAAKELSEALGCVVRRFAINKLIRIHATDRTIESRKNPRRKFIVQVSKGKSRGLILSPIPLIVMKPDNTAAPS